MRWAVVDADGGGSVRGRLLGVREGRGRVPAWADVLFDGRPARVNPEFFDDPPFFRRLYPITANAHRLRDALSRFGAWTAVTIGGHEYAVGLSDVPGAPAPVLFVDTIERFRATGGVVVIADGGGG